MLADRLHGRFVSHTSAAHRLEIRRRVIPTIRHLGTRERAATCHQLNPLVAHYITLSHLSPRMRRPRRDAFSHLQRLCVIATTIPLMPELASGVPNTSRPPLPKPPLSEGAGLP